MSQSVTVSHCHNAHPQCRFLPRNAQVSIFDACAETKGKIHLPTFLKLLHGDGSTGSTAQMFAPLVTSLPVFTNYDYHFLFSHISCAFQNCVGGLTWITSLWAFLSHTSHILKYSQDISPWCALCRRCRWQGVLWWRGLLQRSEVRFFWCCLALLLNNSRNFTNWQQFNLFKLTY